MAIPERSAEIFDACEQCGESLEPGVRYPVSVRKVDGDPHKLLSFCNESCQRTWEARPDR